MKAIIRTVLLVLLTFSILPTCANAEIVVHHGGYHGGHGWHNNWHNNGYRNNYYHRNNNYYYSHYNYYHHNRYWVPAHWVYRPRFNDRFFVAGHWERG